MAALIEAGVDTAEPRLRLLVLQPTPFCNIDCSYCYLSERQSRARMSLETLDLACRRVFENPHLAPRLEVAWHGGEPLVVPLPWYEEAVALMAERRPAWLQLTHCFQTNGLLLNEDWARFFARTGAKVGLSIDGPADLHDACRRTRHGQGTHAKAMRAVRLLRDQGLRVPCDHGPDASGRSMIRNVSSTSTSRTGSRRSASTSRRSKGRIRGSSLGAPDVETKFRAVHQALLRTRLGRAGLLKVRELESAIGHLLSDEPVQDEQNLPFAIVSVGHDGTISTFSPELWAHVMPVSTALHSDTPPRIARRTSSTRPCSGPSAVRSGAASKRASAAAAFSDGAAAERRRTSCSRPDASTRRRRCTAG